MRLSEGAAGRLGICPDLWHVVVGHPTESVTGPVSQGTRRTMRILHSPLMGCGIPGPVTVGPGSPLLEACGGHRIRVASCPDASSYFNKKSRHDVGDQVKGMGVSTDDIRDPIPSEVTPSIGEFSIRGGGGHPPQQPVMADPDPPKGSIGRVMRHRWRDPQSPFPEGRSGSRCRAGQSAGSDPAPIPSM